MSYPSLFQFNTRIILNERSTALHRRATLDDLPDEMLDRLARQGFDWVWPLGVWQTGAAALQVSRSRPEWLSDFRHALPDLTEADITGSPFAITAYELNRDFGDRDSLPRLRERLRSRGLKLLLDFVPNHCAPDHPWTATHREFFIHGTPEKVKDDPQ